MTSSSPPSVSGDSLYAAQPTIHPRAVSGVFRRLKTTVSLLLLGLTAVGPWLRWPRPEGLPGQAVLFSFTTMRAYFFGLEIWAQEFYYVTALLVIAGLLLFAVTTLYGRIWCGFACPQTVWTDLFVGIEKWVEGDRNRRLALEKAPWNAAKIGLKVLKHSLWLLVSAITGAIFCFYFTDAVQGSRAMLTGQATEVLYGFWALFAAMTYVMAGWGREQVCTYMCPWPRIQGGMLDEQTLTVSYDPGRGEGRAHAKAGQNFAGRGHCVDCLICVQVCPVGIDIRQGAQMECISCGLCVDGCDGVMRHFGLPPKLIGWKAINSPLPSPVLRPRIVVYGALILLTGLLALYGLSRRPALEMAILPDRSPLSVAFADGSVGNGYTVHISNHGGAAVSGELGLDGLPGGHLVVPGGPNVTVAPDAVATVHLFVRQAADQVGAGNRAMALTFGTSRGASRFIAP